VCAFGLASNKFFRFLARSISAPGMMSSRSQIITILILNQKLFILGPLSARVAEACAADCFEKTAGAFAREPLNGRRNFRQKDAD